MNNTYATGSPIVDQMAKVRITGNIINPYWYKNILYENEKPNLNAINILADIVYWHRPTEVRDEETGEQIGLKKKFKGKSFHRSYRQFQNQFGLSKRQIQLALQALEDILEYAINYNISKNIFIKLIFFLLNSINIGYLSTSSTIIPLKYSGL